MNQENKEVKVINEKMRMKESVSITKCEDDQIVGSSYGDSDGKVVSADIDKTGVKHRFVGQPIRSRDNELKVAKILVDKINNIENLYQDPIAVKKTDDIRDCIAYGVFDEKLSLNIQIVNSNNDSKYWRNIAKIGSCNTIAEINDLCDQIIKAIKDKSKKYGKNTISDITLALDATANPQHALDKIIDNLKNEYHNELSESGFKEVWIVGPSISMTNCIFFHNKT